MAIKPRKTTERSRPKVAAVPDSGADGGVRTLHLGLTILEYLVMVGTDKGVTDIADHFELTKARTFRLLQTLVDRGYAVQDVASSRYAPSVRLFALGQALSDRFDFATAAKAEAHQLWENLGHTIVTSTIFKDRILVLEVIRGRTPISLGLKTGAVFDLASSAQGRLAMAFGPSHLLERALKEPMVAHTPKTIVSAAKLSTEIKRIQLQGWASAPDQQVVGMNAVAAPVFQHDGTLAGTVAVCALTQFVTHPPTEDLIDQLTMTSLRVSRKLGWSGKILATNDGR